MLAMFLNADLPAEFEHRAFRASWHRAGAYVFTERDEQAVELHPVTARELVFERNGSALRRARPDIPPAIGHAMHMYVNADAGLIAGDSQHEVGAFRTDAFKRQQRLGLTWQGAFIFLDDASRDQAYLLRLAIVKCAGAYQPIDFASR